MLRFMKQCLMLAMNSPCPRAKFGAIIVDPISNRNLSEGWNGAPKGDYVLCWNTSCVREVEDIPSGQRTEAGCHHAEANALMNACAEGVSTKGKWIFVNGAPCLSCAKLIHHSDISTVVMLSYNRSHEGLAYLNRHNVSIQTLSPKLHSELLNS